MPEFWALSRSIWASWDSARYLQLGRRPVRAYTGHGGHKAGWGGTASVRNLQYAACCSLLLVPGCPAWACRWAAGGRWKVGKQATWRSQGHLLTEKQLRPSDNNLLGCCKSPLLMPDMQNCTAILIFVFCYDHYLKTSPARGQDQHSAVVSYLCAFWTQTVWIQILSLSLTPWETWVSNLSHLCLRFLIWKMGLIIVLTS